MRVNQAALCKATSGKKGAKRLAELILKAASEFLSQKGGLLVPFLRLRNAFVACARQIRSQSSLSVQRKKKGSQDLLGAFLLAALRCAIVVRMVIFFLLVRANFSRAPRLAGGGQVGVSSGRPC